jgi:predicted ATPase
MPVVSELLRRVDLAQPFDQFARMRVMESLVAVIEDNGPFVLVLDDSQWADPESIAALAYLQRRCPSAPVAVLLTSERPAVHRQPERGLSPDIRIDLDELTPDDLAPLDHEVYRVTHGLPLYVAAWLEAREQGLPHPFTAKLRER